MHTIALLCYTQIIYNTNTYFWTVYNVRIPIITVIITDVWCVRKSQAVTLCMYLYHFITIGASGNFFKIINTHFRYQIIVIISRLCSNTVIYIAVHAMPTAWWELACLEQAFRAWHDCTHMRRFSVVLVKWLVNPSLLHVDLVFGLACPIINLTPWLLEAQCRRRLSMYVGL